MVAPGVSWNCGDILLISALSFTSKEICEVFEGTSMLASVWLLKTASQLSITTNAFCISHSAFGASSLKQEVSIVQAPIAERK